ncbi:MAG: hypothetical protein FD125_173 [bacterium]|nr:MAG: hypothetical protein FD125_173 [bacterium]
MAETPIWTTETPVVLAATLMAVVEPVTGSPAAFGLRVACRERVLVIETRVPLRSLMAVTVAAPPPDEARMEPLLVKLGSEAPASIWMATALAATSLATPPVMVPRLMKRGVEAPTPKR